MGLWTMRYGGKLLLWNVDNELQKPIYEKQQCMLQKLILLTKDSFKIDYFRIVDGGDGEFDGKTLGFNHFRVNENRDASADFRSKIGDVRLFR